MRADSPWVRRNYFRKALYTSFGNRNVTIFPARLGTFLLAIATNHMVHVEWNGGKKAAFTPVPEVIKFPT